MVVRLYLRKTMPTEFSVRLKLDLMRELPVLKVMSWGMLRMMLLP